MSLPPLVPSPRHGTGRLLEAIQQIGPLVFGSPFDSATLVAPTLLNATQAQRRPPVGQLNVCDSVETLIVSAGSAATKKSHERSSKRLPARHTLAPARPPAQMKMCVKGGQRLRTVPNNPISSHSLKHSFSLDRYSMNFLRMYLCVCVPACVRERKCVYVCVYSMLWHTANKECFY